MKKPTLTSLLEKYEGTGITRYSLVIGIAKRAREIQAEAEAEKIQLTERPVILASDDVINERVVIKEQ